ncbi:MAG: hypothetical protein ABSG78_22970 [Verrucomicrobiota bacterium]|jgi:hypothetical protein
MMAVGFYFRNIEEYPSLLKRIAPDYVQGVAAIHKVNSGGTLVPGDDGFEVLSKFFLEKFSQANNNMKMPEDVKVESVQEGMALVSLDQTIASDFRVKFSTKTTRIIGGNEYHFSANEISKWLEKSKRDALFIIGRWIFLIGLMVEVVFYSIDIFAYVVALPKKPAKAKAVQADPKKD